ncbi:MAG TPA: tryptophan synthase subunit alpha, partial [Nitrospiraceae bacterium]|nr:tryptophan synthase subunit alpha [Nitrospiraceae bacterium]
TPDQAAQVAMGGADGVIVGSAIVKLVDQNSGSSDLVQTCGSFVKALKEGILAAQR